MLKFLNIVIYENSTRREEPFTLPIIHPQQLTRTATGNQSFRVCAKDNPLQKTLRPAEWVTWQQPCHRIWNIYNHTEFN